MNLEPQSLFRSLVHERHKARQALGVLLLILIVVLSAPTSALLYLLGALLAVLGITVRLWGAGHLKKDQELAQDGPYAVVRHPLYVGNTLIISGFLIAAQVGWLLIVALAFAALYYPPAIRREDAKLHKLFGEAWQTWAADTHALIPKRLPEWPIDLSRWSFSQSLRANGEPIIAALLLLGLFVMGGRAF